MEAVPLEDLPISELEAPELAGYADMWAAAPAELAERRGIAHAEVKGAVCCAVASMPTVRVVNHALGLPADAPVPDDQLAAIEDFYAEREIPALLALADGAPAEDQLHARGYRPGFAWVKFVRGTAPGPDPPVVRRAEITVRPLAGVEGERMGSLVAAGFDLPDDVAPWLGALVGRPGWRCLGAYDAGTLVGTGALFVHGESGWLTWAATDPDHRGRGIQKAMLSARIELAGRLGLRTLVCETGEQEHGRPDASFRNILAAGFRPAYRRPFWSRPEDG